MVGTTRDAMAGDPEPREADTAAEARHLAFRAFCAAGAGAALATSFVFDGAFGFGATAVSSTALRSPYARRALGPLRQRCSCEEHP